MRETEKLAAQTAGREIRKRGAGKDATFKDPNLLALEKDISSKLGLVVRINMNGEQDGALSIEFKNLDQLDDVLARLSNKPV